MLLLCPISKKMRITANLSLPDNKIIPALYPFRIERGDFLQLLPYIPFSFASVR